MTYMLDNHPMLVTMSAIHPGKSERLNLRLDAAAKRRIEEAAAVRGQSVSSFIVASALASAERTMREHETMVLSRRDAEVFLDAIMRQPQPSARLRKAILEHRRRVITG